MVWFNRFVWLMLVWGLAGCAELPNWGATTNPTPTPVPVVQQLPPPTAVDNLNLLLNADIPPRDLADLARRYKQADLPDQLPITPQQTGDVQTFWYKEGGSDLSKQVEAQLVYQDEALQLWVDQRESVDSEKVAEVAQTLREQILPTNRELFGMDDARLPLTILHISEIGGGTIGYFSAADLFPTAVNPYSNQRKMAYISLKLAPLASQAYYEVLAHELQHMLQWYTDGNESTWLNEGMAELAVTLNEYSPSQHLTSYLRQPATSLTNFQYDSADYGTAYLFATYFHDRLGVDKVRSLARDPDNGWQSIENQLEGTGMTATELFGDWLVTNYLASHGRDQAPWQYSSLSLPQPIQTQELPTIRRRANPKRPPTGGEFLPFARG
jgi:immune inhibitor A